MIKQNNSLAKKIHLTIIGFVLLFCIVAVGAIYWSAESFSQQRSAHDLQVADGALDSNINFEKTALLQTLSAIKNNKEFVEKFKNRDREALLACTKPFFEEIKSKYEITHFYFITPQKECYLRVHKPEQHGDIIERATLKRAIKTNAEFVDLEMGKNFFSMRAVTPVYEGKELIGYIEIGREMDHFFPKFKKQTGFDISLALEQKYVELYQKSTGTRLQPEGETVGGYVILNSSDANLTKKILLNSKNSVESKTDVDDTNIDDKDYFCYRKRLKDATGEYAGIYIITSEHTALHRDINKQYALILAALLFTIAVLAYTVKISIDKEILNPIDKIGSGVVNFFAYLRGDAKSLTFIEPMKDNEIGAIAMTLNESMEETMQILEEHKRNEAYLLQKSRVSALGEVIANMAHHWRQPLNIIAITAQDILYAKEGGEMDDEYLSRSVHTITDTTKELSATLDRLRNLYGQKSFKEEFCVEEEVKNTISLFKEYMLCGAVEIDFDASQTHIVSNYKNELAQTLIGILQNSQEAMEKNNIEHGKISVEVSASKDSVLISVTDNGGGVDDAIFQHMFDPYFTTKFKSNDVGLGLYLAKVSIEKNMSGKLMAKKVDGGLMMTIELPSLVG